mgnify:CR=1 FL=1
MSQYYYVLEALYKRFKWSPGSYHEDYPYVTDQELGWESRRYHLKKFLEKSGAKGISLIYGDYIYRVNLGGSPNLRVIYEVFYDLYGPKPPQ